MLHPFPIFNGGAASTMNVRLPSERLIRNIYLAWIAVTAKLSIVRKISVESFHLSRLCGSGRLIGNLLTADG